MKTITEYVKHNFSDSVVTEYLLQDINSTNSVIFTTLKNDNTPVAVIPTSTIGEYIDDLDNLYYNMNRESSIPNVDICYRIWNANVGGNNLGRANIINKTISKWIKNINSEYFLIWCTPPTSGSIHVSYFIRTTNNLDKFVSSKRTIVHHSWSDILDYIENI